MTKVEGGVSGHQSSSPHQGRGGALITTEKEGIQPQNPILGVCFLGPLSTLPAFGCLEAEPETWVFGFWGAGICQGELLNTSPSRSEGKQDKQERRVSNDTISDETQP